MIDIRNCDCVEMLQSLEDDSVDCIVTSPPYNKSYFNKISGTHNLVWSGAAIDYGEYSDDMPLDKYEEWMIDIINLCLIKLKPNGSFFFNHKPIRYDNQIYHPISFILRSHAKIYQEIIWNRKNSPNVRKDILVPCTERIWWLCKGKPRLFRDELPQEYISEVWDISAKPMKEHPAPFPEELAANCIKLSTEKGDLVVDPFTGSGTTAVVSDILERNFIGSELLKEFYELAKKRVEKRRSDDLFCFFNNCN